MPLQGITSRFEDYTASEALGSLSCAVDVSAAFPLPSEASFAYATAPLPSYVVKHGSGLVTARFGYGG